MKTLLLGAALLAANQVSAAAWNYIKHGADWGDDCVGKMTDGSKITNQTPINLVTKEKNQKEFSKYPLIEGVKDKTEYFNLVDRQILWDGHTSTTSAKTTAAQTALSETQPTSYFVSSIPKDKFGAKVEITFEAAQFHFHSPSEHTFDGQYFDLEMHTVHYPKEGTVAGDTNGFVAAALGIMFSVDQYTAKVTAAEQMIIDNFFATLQWDDVTNTDALGPKANLVAYGDLINIVDFHNRWVYKGSVTTPPCAQSVFWNELSTVYPISQSVVDQFKAQLNREFTNKDGLKNSQVYVKSTQAQVGNYREIQKIDDHNVMYVSNSATLVTQASVAAAAAADKVESENNTGILVAIVILLILVLLIAMAVLGMTYKNMQSSQKTVRVSASGHVEMSNEVSLKANRRDDDAMQ